MATNKLTPTADIATREFFTTVANDASYLQHSPAHRRQLMAILLEALHYNQLPNGSFVSKDVRIAIPFGSVDYSNYPDEWQDDKERAYNATINNQDTVEASTSSESEGAEVREAVLSEDVQ